jgi:PadR family transcriptional regulator PadR
LRPPALPVPHASNQACSPPAIRLEERGFIAGRWVEKSGQRRRRYYRVTAQGRAVLREQRNAWADFVDAVNRIAGGEHA